METLKEFVKRGDANGTITRVQELLQKGSDVETILNGALIPAMDEVGELFQKREYFIPEMLVAARAMKGAMEVLRPYLEPAGSTYDGSSNTHKYYYWGRVDVWHYGYGHETHGFTFEEDELLGGGWGMEVKQDIWTSEKLGAWVVIVGVFVVMMGANLVIKMAEIEALGRS